MNLDHLPFESAELQRVSEVLGSPGSVTYALPHVYPMSAPSFGPNPCAERERPETEELGLYIHIPFCNYTCTFCFFAKQLPSSQAQLQQYVTALKQEIAWVKPGTRLTQLLIGGGTPSILPSILLDELLSAVFDRFEPHPHNVHTFECSPDSISAEHLEVLRRYGIERVSMGVQSLQPGVLEQVNRRHSPEQVLAACDLIISAGFMLNVDLIYGLPGQTPESFCQDFDILAARGIHSVTAYNLRVNETTSVGRSLNETERLNDLRRLLQWRTAVRMKSEQYGFTSSRGDTFLRRNPATARKVVERFTNIAGHGNQFGIGVSARSRLNDRVYRNHTQVETYLQRMMSGESPVEETMDLSAQERRFRFVSLSLGDGKPLSRPTYYQTFGSRFDEDFADSLQRLKKVDLLEDDGFKITLNERGQLLYDLVIRAFYPRRVRQWLDDRQQLAHTAVNLRPKVSEK